jgi:hypothetical protein
VAKLVEDPELKLQYYKKQTIFSQVMLCLNNLGLKA